MSLFGIEIARRGLMAHQKSLEVTGHNIANASNTSYSRQEAVHKTTLPYHAPALGSANTPGQLGTGVMISEIRRIRNEYIDSQFRDSTSASSYWSNRLDVLRQVESIFPEPNGRGIQEVMINLFSDWHDLNNTPQDAGIKTAVVESGQELARLIRDTYNQLQNVNKGITDKLQNQVATINELVNRIQDITTSIIKVIKEGKQPNDLLDKRDALLDELSQYGPLTFYAGDNGGINVYLFDQNVIKTDNVNFNVYKNKVEIDIESDEISLSIVGQTETTTIQLGEYETGSLEGLVSARQSNDDFIKQLNTLAITIGQSVNALYNPGDKIQPQNFWVFEDANGTTIADTEKITAGDLYVHKDLISNPAHLDGTQALDIARLRNRTSVYSAAIDFNDPGDPDYWQLTITTTNDAKILKDFTFEFANNAGGPLEIAFDPQTKQMTIQADWENEENAPSLAEIQAAINETFSQKGYNAQIKLGVNGAYNPSDLATVTEYIQLNDVFNNSEATLEGRYRNLIANIGAKTDSAANMFQNQQAILRQISSLRESVSGVSLDEELSRMIQFQYGYQASARVMSTLDDILDTLINRII